MILFRLSMLSFVCFAAFAGAAAAGLRIVDGDTIELDGVMYRINGIDAPEHGQKCGKSMSGTWTCGKAATEYLEQLTAGGAVRCEGLSQDQYGRTIADCYAGDVDLGEAMVRTGHAWAFLQYSDKYVKKEAQARDKQLGIWQAPSQPAWEYRAERWNAGRSKAPEGCPIKGNISRNGRIYHAPWSPWYDRTKINTAKGERWFCDEAAAIAAGWRAPYWGGRARRD